MNDSIIQIALDMQEVNGLVSVRMKRGDTARKIVISLSDGGFPYEIAPGCYAVLLARKPDGSTLYNDCVISGNYILYDVSQQTTAAAGRMFCEVRLYAADNAVVTSAKFQVIVEDTVYDDEAVESASEFTALTKLVSEIVKITKEGEDIYMLDGATEKTLLEILSQVTSVKNVLAGGVAGFNNFGGIANVVRTGDQSIYFDTGHQLHTTWQETAEADALDDPFDIVQVECAPELKNGETVHGMMLQQHFANVRGCPFDAQEALYDADEELPAGTYHFTVAGDTWLTSENGKVIQFTLTKPIPAGGQLVYADSNGHDKVIAGQKINTYASPTSFEVIESVTLSEGSGGTDLGTTDGKGNLNHHQRAFRGCGRWKTSMLRQYLNSSKPAGEWWTKQDKWDRASTFINSCPGYMAGFPAEFLAAIKPVKVQTARDTVVYGGGTDITYDYFFPISLEQLNAAPQVAGVEGEALPYWKEVAAGDTTGNLDTSGRFKQYGTYPDLRVFGLNARTTARSCWLRSAYRGNSCSAWVVGTSGNVTHGYALNGHYCAPACVIC